MILRKGEERYAEGAAQRSGDDWDFEGQTGSFRIFWSNHKHHSTALIAVQPSFSTVRCKTLNIFIKVCYSLPVVAAMLEDSDPVGTPRRSLSTFLRLIPTPIHLTPKSHGIISFADPHP